MWYSAQSISGELCISPWVALGLAPSARTLRARAASPPARAPNSAIVAWILYTWVSGIFHPQDNPERLLHEIGGAAAGGDILGDFPRDQPLRMDVPLLPCDVERGFS